jgi:hypothetical protein
MQRRNEAPKGPAQRELETSQWSVHPYDHLSQVLYLFDLLPKLSPS